MLLGRALLLSLMAATSLAVAQPTVIVVRHGEKADASKDPALSAAGEARAVHLANLLAASGVKAIYTTEYRRTQQLAQPLAARTGVTPVTIPAADAKALMSRLQAQADTDTVLVVGHSNTVPAIVKALGVKDEVKVAEDEYDNLFIVVPRGERSTALRIKY